MQVLSAEYLKIFEWTQSQLIEYRKNVKSLISALQKNPDARFQPEQLAISNFMAISPFFNQLVEKFSSDFARSILHESRAYEVRGNRQLCEKGDKMLKILMPLVGSFFIKKEVMFQAQIKTNIFEQLQELIQKDSRDVFVSKSKAKVQKRKTLANDKVEILQTVGVNLKQLSNLHLFNNQHPLFFTGFRNQLYQETLYSSGDTVVLAIPIQNFHKCLSAEYQRRIRHKASFFRKLSCFDILNDSQLNCFVEKLPLIEVKKDQLIFKEGDKSILMYLLIEGECKAQKTVQLFKQDPNALYLNPIKDNQKSFDQYPYADFEGVYNYSPRKKRIQLCIYSPITIFGQQELISGIAREADVIVTSSVAKMFVFEMKQLNIVGMGLKVKIQDFLKQLYQTITAKRIGTRRQKLSNSLKIQNKRNMDYFYLDSRQVVRKSKRARPSTSMMNRSMTPGEPTRPQSAVKPRYHNFNFDQFLPQPKLSFRKQAKLSDHEMKVAKKTHNSSDVAQKVQVTSFLSKQRKIFKYHINIDQPLFNYKQFYDQRKQILRINNMKRNRKFDVSVGSKTARTFSSLGRK